MDTVLKVTSSVSLTEMYQFSVSEGVAVGTSIGRVIATDADMGENTDMSYLIKDEEGGELFRVSTDGDTQEAVITIKKVDGRQFTLWRSSCPSHGAVWCSVLDSEFNIKVIQHSTKRV